MLYDYVPEDLDPVVVNTVFVLFVIVGLFVVVVYQVVAMVLMIFFYHQFVINVFVGLNLTVIVPVIVVNFVQVVFFLIQPVDAGAKIKNLI